MLKNMTKGKYNVGKSTRMIFLGVMDVLTINFAFLIATFIHYEGSIPLDLVGSYQQVFVAVTIAKILIYYYFRLYGSIWEYASIEELIKVVKAVIIANVVSIAYMVYMKVDVYYGVYFVSILFEIVFIGGIRFSYRCLRRVKHHGGLIRQKTSKNILIVGSGATASLIATEIKNHPRDYGQVVGYIDDDDDKIGKTIAGIKVLGSRYDIYSICKRYKVDEIVIAIPTVSNKDKKEIINECRRTSLKVRIIPGITEIIDGKVSINKARDVEIEDLLGRDPVNLNVGEIATYIEDQVVLVTGGGGSIGSELCRQIAKFNPTKLIILDNYENNAYEIQNELLRAYKDQLNLEVIISSVRDREAMFSIIEKKRPTVIFHAAAHKHVPLMESSPKEAIKNNVFGTMNVAEAAHKFKVKRFVLISTDKAVNPSNVMGASKRMCEMIIQGLAKISRTKFVAVRFGNVLGSNGSVIPLFKKQIKEGGPITVTHKEIVRYFMTIPEAAQLVIQAGAIAKGGEIFVLDMGEQVRIYDLAIDLIRLSGLEPYEDIDIKITGLRPGEKLYEELLMDEEGLKNTKYKKIFAGNPSEIEYSILKKTVMQFKDEFCNDDSKIIEMIKYCVPTYKIMRYNEDIDDSKIDIHQKELKEYKKVLS